MTVLEFAGYSFAILMCLILSAIIGLIAGFIFVEAMNNADKADDERS